MTLATVYSDDDLRQAAELTFALLRFEQAAAHRDTSSTPVGVPHIGTDAYLFTPSWRRVPRTDVVPFLVSLGAPALLSPTTTQGVVALTVLTELTGERLAWARKTFANQRAGLEELAEQLRLEQQSRILLEFDSEVHVFSLAVLRAWADNFAVQVGWNLGPLQPDPRADAQLHVRRSDGVWAPAHDRRGAA